MIEQNSTSLQPLRVPAERTKSLSIRRWNAGRLCLDGRPLIVEQMETGTST